jgi:hypothetical protein
MAQHDILEIRKSFHEFMDPMWQYGRFSRDALYKSLSTVLNKQAHVAQMSIKEMQKCAEFLISIDRKAYPCHSCKNFVAMRHFFPVCKEQIERSTKACYAYKAKECLCSG